MLELANNPWFTLIAGVVGIVSFPVAIYLYFKQKERFSLGYKVAEKRLIQSSMTRPFDMDVPLSWKGIEVSRLTRTFFLIRNIGNKLIERSDVVGAAAIRVSDGSNIIDADLIFTDDPASAVVVGKADDRARSIEFDFLRPGDGFILKVDHTGDTNEAYIDLKTKAGGPIKKVSDGLRVILWLAGVLVGASGLGNIVWRNITFPPPLDPLNYLTAEMDAKIGGSIGAGAAVLLIIVLMVFLIDWIFHKYFYRRKAPKPKPAEEIFSNIALDKENALVEKER